jgi:drug/metabolite transporter (DMT)-like permease
VCFLQLRVGQIPRLDRAPLLAGRVVFHFLAGWLYYLAIERSNAALGNVLHMSYPFFAALIVCVAGRSKSPRADLALSVLSVGGIALTSDLAGSSDAIALGVLSGISGALSVILLSNTRQGNSTVSVFFYTFLGGLLLSLLVARPHFQIGSHQEIFYLALSAAFGIAGQFCFTYGAAFVPAVESGILSCLRIPLALVGAAAGFEQAPLSLRAWLGASMVFAANVVVLLRRRKSARIAAALDEAADGAGEI